MTTKALTHPEARALAPSWHVPMCPVSSAFIPSTPTHYDPPSGDHSQCPEQRHSKCVLLSYRRIPWLFFS